MNNLRGTLYIVATPIGNLGDMSPRAIETLQAVDRIACEDTRHTIKLLNHFGIHKPLTSYHDFNEENRSVDLAARIAGGESIALVSDAGTPGISDPGYRIVRSCREQDLPVISIPGPSAAVSALAASGLSTDEFMFVGFLPPKQGARREKLTAVRNVGCTLVFYEAPHRIDAALQDMQEVLNDREVCVAREISKIHEEYLFGRLSTVREAVKPIGEFVVVVEGAKESAPDLPPTSREEVLKRLGLTRNQLYDLFFKK